MTPSWRKLGAVGMLAMASLAQAEPGQITATTDLKSAPAASAGSAGRLEQGQTVQVGERQGAWYRVQTPAGDGWVRMLNVRLASGDRNSGASTASGIAALGQATRSNTTVATGIRGLSREDLQRAQDDQGAVAQLDQYRISAEEARQFGQAAGLPAPRR